MMKHVLRLHIVGRWKRLLLIFLLSGAAVSVFPPVYFPISAVPSLLDWLLEVSGSLLVIAFFAGLSVTLLCFDTTQWLWTPFGTASLARISKRSTLFWAYITLGTSIAAYVVIILIFWSIVIGYFKFGGYAHANSHPFFQLTDSPFWFVVSRWFIDWWCLCFIVFLGMAGAFIMKKVLISFMLSLGWSFGITGLFKANISSKGLIPGEGMILSVHAYGADPLIVMLSNECAVLLLWFVFYRIIVQTNLVMPRADR
ncbi:hypothetical protein [Bacillus sonorensis]|uniref:hypothetical protein n=1 Tax=Bacillus sonorensis TaxID=119858 RepID=UPI002282499C|nr:hypothetical protein [Bacillus sonorensis]MCY8089173.1 hypothetical protein [Bacillus sonorensis]MCY8402792.1 hypothetical protein [Bacillus sonorensis]MEC1500706.1 hypothetical protein [Bacillus sonorensis]